MIRGQKWAAKATYDATLEFYDFSPNHVSPNQQWEIRLINLSTTRALEWNVYTVDIDGHECDVNSGTAYATAVASTGAAGNSLAASGLGVAITVQEEVTTLRVKVTSGAGSGAVNGVVKVLCGGEAGMEWAAPENYGTAGVAAT